MPPDVASSRLSKVISLCKKHGFVSSNQFHLNGHEGTWYSYGPLGMQMRLNLCKEWWKWIVTSQNNVFGCTTPHLSMHNLQTDVNHSDSISISKNSEGMSPTRKTFRERLKETFFLHFYHASELANQKFPFGIAQSGVCFADQQSSCDNADKFLYSSPEFTELSLMYFTSPKTSIRWFDYWQRQRVLWWRKFACSPSSFSTTSIQCTDSVQRAEIRFNFPWGPSTVETVSNMEDQDIESMETSLGVKLRIKEGRKLVTPHVIEAVSTLERALLVYLLDAFYEKEKTDSKGQKSLKTVLRLHHHLVPFKVAITASSSTPFLWDLVNFLVKELKEENISVLEGNVGLSLDSQYSRFDEIGVPFIVTLNETTLQTGVATIRNRDTTVKEQCHMTEVKKTLKVYLSAY